MSWSLQYVGTPAAVKKALDGYGEQLTGQSKVEFEEVKPALQALVAVNVGEKVCVKLAAAGHATLADGNKTYGSCSVVLDQFYGLVEE